MLRLWLLLWLCMSIAAFYNHGPILDCFVHLFNHFYAYRNHKPLCLLFKRKVRADNCIAQRLFHLQLIFSCMGFVEHRWPVGITFWVKFQLSVSLRGWTFPPSVYIQVSVAQVIWSRKILMRNVHMEISDVCIFLLYRVSLFLNKGNAENRSEFSKLRYSYDKLRDM